MAELHIFPGVERRDLLPTDTCQNVLDKASKEGLIEATIVGRTRDGSFYLTSTLGDVDKMVGILHRALTLAAAANLCDQKPLNTEDANA